MTKQYSTVELVSRFNEILLNHDDVDMIYTLENLNRQVEVIFQYEIDKSITYRSLDTYNPMTSSYTKVKDYLFDESRFKILVAHCHPVIQKHFGFVPETIDYFGQNIRLNKAIDIIREEQSFYKLDGIKMLSYLESIGWIDNSFMPTEVSLNMGILTLFIVLKDSKYIPMTYVTHKGMKEITNKLNIFYSAF